MPMIDDSFWTWMESLSRTFAWEDRVTPREGHVGQDEGAHHVLPGYGKHPETEAPPVREDLESAHEQGNRPKSKIGTESGRDRGVYYDPNLPQASLANAHLTITGESGTGKALDVETPILTDRGWRTMADLQDGDFVFGPDGNPTRVSRAWEPYIGDCYRVEFSDGSSLVADRGHLWEITGSSRGARPVGPKVVTTEELLSLYSYQDGGWRAAYVELAAPPKTEEGDLPIHPYVLGAWLGDGNKSDCGITVHPDSDEILDKIGMYHEIHSWKTDPMKTPRYGIQGLGAPLKELGLIANKHIPDIYLAASVPQRYELLRGLLDTDGSCDERQGAVEFSNTNEKLALGVLCLARSLGFRATIQKGVAKLNGIEIGPKWKVAWTAYGSDHLFNIGYKQSNVLSHERSGRNQKKTVKSIYPAGRRLVRCITVEHERGLYVAGRAFTVTHNTQLMKTLLADLRSYGVPSLVLDFKDDYAEPKYAGTEGFTAYDPAKRPLPFNPLEPLVDPQSGEVNPTFHTYQLAEIIGRVYHLGEQQQFKLREAIKACYAEKDGRVAHMPGESPQSHTMMYKVAPSFRREQIQENGLKSGYGKIYAWNSLEDANKWHEFASGKTKLDHDIWKIDSCMLDVRLDDNHTAIWPNAHYLAHESVEPHRVELVQAAGTEKTASVNQWPTFDDVKVKLQADKGNAELLGRLAPIFDFGFFSDPDPQGFSQIIGGNTVIRLAQLPSNEVKNSVAEFFLMALYNHLVRLEQTHLLRQVLVLDEAWRVVQSPFLEPLMREARAFGLGVFVATQFPTDLPLAVSGSAATDIYLGQTTPSQIAEVQNSIVGGTTSSEAERLATVLRGLLPLQAIIRNRQYDPYVKVDARPYYARGFEAQASVVIPGPALELPRPSSRFNLNHTKGASVRVAADKSYEVCDQCKTRDCHPCSGTGDSPYEEGKPCRDCSGAGKVEWGGRNHDFEPADDSINYFDFEDEMPGDPVEAGAWHNDMFDILHDDHGVKVDDLKQGTGYAVCSNCKGDGCSWCKDSGLISGAEGPDYNTAAERLNAVGLDTYFSDTRFEVYNGKAACEEEECHDGSCPWGDACTDHSKHAKVNPHTEDAHDQHKDHPEPVKTAAKDDTCVGCEGSGLEHNGEDYVPCELCPGDGKDHGVTLAKIKEFEEGDGLESSYPTGYHLTCPTCGDGPYGANPADYWDKPDDEEFRCSNGHGMRLMQEVVRNIVHAEMQKFPPGEDDEGDNPFAPFSMTEWNMVQQGVRPKKR